MTNIAKMLIVDEGLRYKAYKDITGKTTVGIGFNMDNPSARGIWLHADIPESFNTIYAGQFPLSTNSISKLFNTCIDNCRIDLESMFTDFNNFPNYVQLALINLMFNMGKPVLSQFHTFINLIESNDYDGASTDLSTTKWASELPNRAKRVAALLKNDDSGYTAYSIDTSTFSS